MLTNWRSARRIAAVLWTSAMCAACQRSDALPLIRLSLPPAPSTFGLPVAVPEPRKGQDVRVFAAGTRRALLEANQRLRDDGSFYRDVQQKFGAPAGADEQ
mgnify:CR=1 FL=1